MKTSKKPSSTKTVKKLEDSSMKKIKGGNIKGGIKHNLRGVDSKSISS